MSQYPIENLLRRPVELCTTMGFTVAAGVLVANPGFFWLSSSLAWPIAVILLLLSVWRAMEGWGIIRYQQYLKRLPEYKIAPKDIPWSKHALFVGMGFKWEPKHTARLAYLREPENQEFGQPGSLYRLARRMERKLEHTPYEWVGDWLAKPSMFNPFGPLPEVGGDPRLHGVEPDEEPIWQSLTTRVAHTLVEGTTRVGKTRMLEVFISQDIRRGDSVICFDPKGDAGIVRTIYGECVRSGRKDDFIFFHLGYPQYSALYNPVGDFNRITEPASKIANNMPSEGNSAAFKQFVWRYVNSITRADVALGNKPSYARMYQHAENVEPLVIDYLEHWLDREPAAKNWREDIREIDINPKDLDRAMKSRPMSLVKMLEFVKSKRLYDPIASSLIGLVQYEASYFQKLVASLYPFLEKVTTGEIAELLSPNYANPGETRPTFDWMSALESGKVVYFGLDALEDSEVAGAVGNAAFSDLTSVAGKIYKHDYGYGQVESRPKRRLSIHGDELNELIGNEFIPMVNKAGGAMYQVTGYTQTRADIEAKVGSSAKAKQIEGNFNTRFFMRVLGQETAELLTKTLPEVKVNKLVPTSGVSDTNDPGDFAEFGSRNDDRIVPEKVPMLTPADVIQLPKGQAFMQLDGHLYKIRLPLLDTHDDIDYPPDLMHVMRSMEAKQRARDTAQGAGTPNTQLTKEGKGVGF